MEKNKPYSYLTNHQDKKRKDLTDEISEKFSENSGFEPNFPFLNSHQIKKKKLNNSIQNWKQLGSSVDNLTKYGLTRLESYLQVNNKEKDPNILYHYFNDLKNPIRIGTDTISNMKTNFASKLHTYSQLRAKNIQNYFNFINSNTQDSSQQATEDDNESNPTSDRSLTEYYSQDISEPQHVDQPQQASEAEIILSSGDEQSEQAQDQANEYDDNEIEQPFTSYETNDPYFSLATPQSDQIYEDKPYNSNSFDYDDENNILALSQLVQGYSDDEENKVGYDQMGRAILSTDEPDEFNDQEQAEYSDSEEQEDYNSQETGESPSDQSDDVIQLSDSEDNLHDEQGYENENDQTTTESDE